MKTSVLTYVTLLLISATAFAQSKEVYDDVYFKSGDVVKKAERPLTKKPVYKNGAKEIIFIERGQEVEIVTPDTTVLLGEANDSTEQYDEKGYYLNGFNGSESDLEYAARIRKFHNPKYRVFIGDPAYNDIYFLNNYDWNVYVDGSYAYVTPTWTNPYWFDYNYSPNSYWGWNRWNCGSPYYGYNYGWGNYPWSMNNYWGYGGYHGGYYGNYYGGYYGGYYGSYYGGYYGYGMGYPYYGYGGHGYYGYYGSGYGGGGSVIKQSRATGTREYTNMRTSTIGGGGVARNSMSIRSNYTAVGENNRNIVNTNGVRSIRTSTAVTGRNSSVQSNNRTVTNGYSPTENNYRPSTYRSSTITTNRTMGTSTESVNRSSYSTGSRETGARSTYNPGTSTSPRTNYSTQQNQSTRSGSVNTTSRSSYSTGTPSVSRQSNYNYSNGSTSTRSSTTNSGSYRSSTPSSSYSSGSSSYSSGGSSYSGGSSSGGSSSSSSSSGGGGGGRR